MALLLAHTLRQAYQQLCATRASSTLLPKGGAGPTFPSVATSEGHGHFSHSFDGRPALLSATGWGRDEIREELVSSLTTAWLLSICVCLSTGKQVYQQCWRFSDCNAKFIMSRLELAEVQYRCCQVDLCNKNLEEGSGKPNNAATSLLGKTALLGTSVLAAILKLCF